MRVSLSTYESHGDVEPMVATGVMPAGVRL